MIVLRYLLYLLFILLPFGELLRFNIGNDIYLKPLDIAACITTLWFVGWIIVTKQVRKNLRWSLLLFSIVGLFSLLINVTWLSTNQLVSSSLYLIRWIGYTGILLALLQMDKDFRKQLPYILFGIGLLLVIAGFVQYLFYSDIRYLKYIGWDDHMHRLFSTLYDPNFAGALLVLYLLFVTGYLYHFIKEKQKKQVIWLSVVLLLTFIAILLTYSRSALIMLVVGESSLLILLRQKKIILGLLAALIVYVLVVSPLFYIENTNLFRKASTGARLETYENAIRIYQDHPIFGVGFDTYRYAQQSYGLRKVHPQYPSNADSGVDNSLLFVLVTTGIVGFGAYLYFWFACIQRALLSLKSKNNIAAKVFFASVIGLFVNAFFINSLFFPAIILWMWMLITVL